MQLRATTKQRHNEQGFVLISAMLFLLILTVIGVMATNTTTVELQIASNDRTVKTDFYNKEMGLVTANANSRDWLTSAYIQEGIINAHFPKANPVATDDVNENGIDDRSEIKDSAGKIVSIYKVRNLVAPASSISTWDDIAAFDTAENHPANQVPVLPHESKPPVGSGYDPRHFYVRHFVTTVYSPNAGQEAVLQEGTYKAFNRY